jgi:hypothetical protein
MQHVEVRTGGDIDEGEDSNVLIKCGTSYLTFFLWVGCLGSTPVRVFRLLRVARLTPR